LFHHLYRVFFSSSHGEVPDLPQLIYLSGVALTVPYTLRVVVNHKQFLEKQTTEAIDAVLQRGFQMCDAILNSYNRSSEVSAVNSLPVNTVCTCDGDDSVCLSVCLSVFLGRFLLCCIELCLTCRRMRCLATCLQ
jgi:hypothetical protein